MGILDRIERGLERAVNGAFAKTFRSGLQPIEITSALRRELDTKAMIVSRDRTVAPNDFRIHLSTTDNDAMAAHGSALLEELTALVEQHAAEHRYALAGPVRIRFVADGTLSAGMIQVESTSLKGQVHWVAVIDVAGKRYPLTKAATVIGRGHEADITIDDSGASRKHAEVLWDGANARVRDLGSTNGTKVDGLKISTSDLDEQNVITIGRTALRFQVIPQMGDDPYADRRMSGGSGGGPGRGILR